MRHTFRKNERLCSRLLIETLFEKGQGATFFPLRVVWMETRIHQPVPAQVAFSVPKRKFKKAVHRNRIKRLMREVYRLSKHELYQRIGDRQFAVMIIFIGVEEPSLESLDKAWQKFISKLPQNIDHQTK